MTVNSLSTVFCFLLPAQTVTVVITAPHFCRVAIIVRYYCVVAYSIAHPTFYVFNIVSDVESLWCDVDGDAPCCTSAKKAPSVLMMVCKLRIVAFPKNLHHYKPSKSMLLNMIPGATIIPCLVWRRWHYHPKYRASHSNSFLHSLLTNLLWGARRENDLESPMWPRVVQHLLLVPPIPSRVLMSTLSGPLVSTIQTRQFLNTRPVLMATHSTLPYVTTHCTWVRLACWTVTLSPVPPEHVFALCLAGYLMRDCDGRSHDSHMQARQMQQPWWASQWSHAWTWDKWWHIASPCAIVIITDPLQLNGHL
jgi:hypothetical protein